MMIGALISLYWAKFFTACFGMGLLFLIIRKGVFSLSKHFFGLDE